MEDDSWKNQTLREMKKQVKSDLPTSISLWRKIVNRLMSILLIVAVVLAVVPLIYILGRCHIRGAPAISLAFLTHLPTGPLLRVAESPTQ